MATRATDLPADPENSIVELPGQSALSQFRLTKLLGDLQKIDARVSDVAARFSYFVHSHGVLGEDELARGQVTVKDLKEGTQATIDRDGLVAHVRSLLAK